jgi:hypothetical protein
MLKKVYLIIIAFVVLLSVIVVGVYVTQHQSEQFTVGVNAGDIFTYKLVGIAEVYGDAVVPENFMDVNKTDYYRIEITNVDFPFVSYVETLQFKNGTSFNYDGLINVETGVNTISGGFWGIFVADLNEGSLSRPAVSNGAVINSTELRPYLDGDRQTNFLHAETVLVDVEDETLSSECYVNTYVHFDKQLGILVELKDMKIYTNPTIMLTVVWELVDSNVIQVP